MSIAGDLISIDIRAEDAGQRDIQVPAGLWKQERAGRRRAERRVEELREELAKHGTSKCLEFDRVYPKGVVIPNDEERLCD